MFWCDLGGECTSKGFFSFACSSWNIHQTACTDMIGQNSVVERKHRYLVETVHSLLLSNSTPSELWGKAILTAAHLINLGFSPFEKLFGYVPNYSFLYFFGSTYFIIRHRVLYCKLFSRSYVCVFLHYVAWQMGYDCFDLVSQKLYVSYHVMFLEQINFFSFPASSHNKTKFNLICIDPFAINTKIVTRLLLRTSTSTTYMILIEFPLIILQILVLWLLIHQLFILFLWLPNHPLRLWLFLLVTHCILVSLLNYLIVTYFWRML